METKKVYEIIRFTEIDSTSTHAMRNILDFADRQVLSAGKQTAGRGRFDRKWVSDKENNVYISLVLKPCNDINNNLPLSGIAQYMSVVICQTLETYGVTPEIKWPNDVRVNGSKIAGLLMQSSIKWAEFKGLVLGVGINLNLEKEDLKKIDIPATSLNLFTCMPIDKEKFIEKLLDAFFENYEVFLENGFPFIREEYLSRNCFLGKKIAIKNPEYLYSGIAKEILDDGSLMILDEEMQEKQVIVGAIEFC